MTLAIPPDASTNLDAAVPWVREELQRVALQRGWASESLSAALAAVDQAYQEADEADWWGADPETFWRALDRLTAEQPWGQEAGGADLRLLWSTVGQWTEAVQAEAAASSPIEILGGTVSGSVDDVAKTTEAAVKAAEKPSSWLILAAVALGALILSRR